MKIMDITSIIYNAAGLLLGAIVSIVIYLKENKRRKTDQQKILDLEKAMISYSYIKDKAYNLYNNGNYNESLDVFKKYLYNNRDDKEWNEIITYIFRKETEKIFSSNICFNNMQKPNTALLLQAFISMQDSSNIISPYPDIIKTLIDDFAKAFGRKMNSALFLIALLDNDWQKAKNLLPSVNMLKDSYNNVIFERYISAYIDKKMGIDDNSIVEDVPF